jgi:hypothetical protein
MRAHFPSILAVVTALALFAGPCSAQPIESGIETREQLLEYCRKVLCRNPGKILVQLKGGFVGEVSLDDPTPIVLPTGWVTVLPDEEIHVAFDWEGDSIRNLRAVRAGDESPNRFSFRFVQQPGSGVTDLWVASTLRQPVKYDLWMMLPQTDRVVRTSTCPVSADQTMIERWQHPVFQFFLTGFRTLAPGSALKCE